MRILGTSRRWTAIAAVVGLLLALGPPATAQPRLPNGHRITASTNAGVIRLETIRLDSHAAVNVHPRARIRPLRVVATVSDTAPRARAAGGWVSLAQYGRGGTRRAARSGRVLPAMSVRLVRTGTRGSTVTLGGHIRLDRASIASAMRAKHVTRAHVCLASATVTVARTRAGGPAPLSVLRRPAHRAAANLRGGDCVKVINLDPRATPSPFDDPPPTRH